MENYKNFKKYLLKDKEINKAYKDLGHEFTRVKIIIKKKADAKLRVTIS